MSEIYRYDLSGVEREKNESNLWLEYKKLAKLYGIELSPPVEDFAKLVREGAEISISKEATFLGRSRRIVPLSKRNFFPESLRNSNDPKLRLAAAFFSELIKPLLATGKDSYKPTEEDLLEFCNDLINNQLTIVLYYAL